jgi:hypothetical protein
MDFEPHGVAQDFKAAPPYHESAAEHRQRAAPLRLPRAEARASNRTLSRAGPIGHGIPKDGEFTTGTFRRLPSSALASLSGADGRFDCDAVRQILSRRSHPWQRLLQPPLQRVRRLCVYSTDGVRLRRLSPRPRPSGSREVRVAAHNRKTTDSAGRWIVAFDVRIASEWEAVTPPACGMHF